MNRDYRTLTVVIIITLTTISILYYIISSPPAQGYEASIYYEYPPWFWTSYILIITVPILFVIIEKNKKPVLSYLILILALVMRIILNMLPYIRGYFLNSRSDTLLYTGAIKDIIATGFVSPYDFYPGENFLVAILSRICKYKLRSIIFIFPSYLYLILFIWYYILIKYITHQKNVSEKLIPQQTSAISLTLSFGAYFLHRTDAMTLTVVILAVLFSKKLKNNQKTLLFLILFGTLVYWHPLSSLYTLIIFIEALIVMKLIEKTNVNCSAINLSIITGILWTTWYLSFSEIVGNATLAFRSFFDLPGNPYFKQNIQTVNKYHIPIETLIKIAFYRYGKVTILGIIFLFVSVKVVKELKIRNSHCKNIQSLMYSIVGSGTFLLWTIINIEIHFVDYERIFKYIEFFSIPLISYIIITSKKKFMRRAISILLIGLIVYLSIFHVHTGPFLGLENQQITASEYAGWGWIFRNNGGLTIYTGRPFDNKVFYALIYGFTKLHQNSVGYSARELVPHFGYPQHDSVNKVIPSRSYIVTNIFMIIFYKSILPHEPEEWKWTETDYKRLRIDPTSNIIYSTKDYWVHITL